MHCCMIVVSLKGQSRSKCQMNHKKSFLWRLFAEQVVYLRRLYPCGDAGHAARETVTECVKPVKRQAYAAIRDMRNRHI